MRQKFISFASLTVAALMAFSMTACSPDAGDDDGKTDGNVTATTYYITYNYNYGDAENTTVAVNGGSKAERPQDPEREGYTFDDWYREAACENVYSFDTVVSSDMTLYANWEINKYTVTLDYNYSGSVGGSQTVNYGGQVSFAESPERTGYTFAGWYTDELCSELYSNSTEVKSNFTLYAKWTANSYTVTLDYNYDNIKKTLTADYGEKVAPEADPEREGHTFAGWFEDKECTKEYSFDTAVTGDKTIYADWSVDSYTITVDYNHDGVKSSFTLNYGDKLSRPEDPERENYTFAGWCSDAELTEEYSFDSVVKGNLTIYAKWIDDTKEVYEVTFDPNFEGSQDIVQLVEEGGKAVRPADPVREGYTLKGWYTDEQLTEEYSFDTAVNGAVTLYADWTLNTYTVTFDYNYQDAETTSVGVTHGGKVTSPADPERVGYTFGGWFTEATCENAYEFDCAVTSGITLYALWTVNVYSVTFDLNYAGSENSFVEVTHGNRIIQPANPVREGFTFACWNVDAAGTAAFDFNTAVTQDTVIYASWNENRKDYVFEAEDTYLDDIEGKGYSNDAYGQDCIQKDNNGAANASGGYYLGYLYKYGVEVPFEIVSDRDTSDAKLTLRISCELISQVTLSSTQFQIIVNGTALSYKTVTMNNPYVDISIATKREFEDAITISKVTLNEGVNSIVLRVNNRTSIKGTCEATSWLIDCLKISTVANLSWEPMNNFKPN